MAPVEGDDLLLRHDPRKLFLALQIVKSKPTHLSVKGKRLYYSVLEPELIIAEYISIIRDSARCAKDHGPQCSRVLSEAAKTQKAEIAQLKLAAVATNARIAYLERENAELHDKLRLALEPENSEAKGRKRRSDRMLRELEAFNESPPKRRKLESTARTRAQGSKSPEPATSLECLPLPSLQSTFCMSKAAIYNANIFTAKDFLRQLFVVRSLLKQQQPSPRELVDSLVCLTATIVSIATNATASSPSVSNRANRSRNTSRPLASQRRVSHGENIDAFELSLMNNSICALLEGFDHVIPVDSGPVIYEFIKMFRDCLYHVMQAHATGDDLTSRLKTRSETFASLQESSLNDKEEGSRIDPVSRFLVAFLSSLDYKKECHQNILDGCMYFLLSETGKQLNAFVFEDQIDGGHSQYHKVASCSNAATTDERYSLLTPRAAANLVWILERAMSLSSEAASTLKQTNSSKLPLDQGSPARGKARLSDVARRQMQDTLLQPLFENQHDMFTNKLKEPDLLNHVIHPAPPVISPVDVPNWLKQEIWRIVGWETIREKIEW